MMAGRVFDKRIMGALIGVFALVMLSGAFILSGDRGEDRGSSVSPPDEPHFLMTLSLERGYDEMLPFVNERCFYVTEDSSDVVFHLSMRCSGKAFSLEIAERDSGTVLWKQAGSALVMADAAISPLYADRDYVVRLVGTADGDAFVQVDSDSPVLRERVAPEGK